MVGAKDLDLAQVERRKETVLDLFAQSEEVVLVGFCQEENQLDLEISLLDF